MKKFAVFASIFLGYVALCMVISPKLYINAAFDGIKAWALNVLPSVLPFMFFTKAVAELGQAEKVSKYFSKPFVKYLNCPKSASFVFLMSIISGYPVGAKMTADLYLSGKIDKSAAFRMCSFCSTSGPMFIIGAVGIGMLGSTKAGYIILISHILGALANGFAWRKLKAGLQSFDNLPSKEVRKQQSLGEIVSDSTLSILSVGTIIAVFFVIITSLSPLINLLPLSLRGLACGLIEITHGCIDIASTLPLKLATLACSFIISFGGISTMLQSLTMLDKLNMPLKVFFAQKLTHALFATCVCAFLILFL